MTTPHLLVGTRDWKVNQLEVDADAPPETVAVPVGTHHVLNADHLALCEQDRADARAMHPFPGLLWEGDPSPDALRCELCEAMLDA